MIRNPKVSAIRRRAGLVGLVLGGLASMPAQAAPPSPAPGDLRSAGAVDFPTSCNAAVQAEFVRAVALLHSFFYEEARRIFTGVAERDPGCAMAQWGIAQSWWHPIWTPPNPEEMAAGRAAAERAASLKSTPRERAFIDAINAYYAAPETAAKGPVGQSCHGPVGPRDRVAAYEHATRKAYEQFPEDFETQVFQAYAVLALGYATPTDITLANQKTAGAMLEKLWKQNPNHPGVTHYIIHSYDYPPLAERALPAAQAYAAIAPWVPHALHMPSHIFTRLGMWDESVSSNQASAEASRAYAVQRKRTAAEVEELHALDYQMYSYLQESRDVAAKQVFDTVSGVRATYPELEFVGAYALAAVPTRYALERNAWSEAAALPIPQRPQWARFPFVEGLFEYAHALGRVHGGDLDGARKAVERMRALRDATTEAKFDYFKRHLELQIQAAAAWLAHAEGHDDDAVKALRAAAEAEDALGKHPVTPGALVPVREQLGELLLALGRPREALAAYEAALKIYPARFRGLNGAALAAEQAGDRKLARRYFDKLLKQAASADTQRAELKHARQYLAAGEPARPSTETAELR
jgi:tetratricopeptide (TPR) repeat protein